MAQVYSPTTYGIRYTAKQYIEFAFRDCGNLAEVQTPQYIDAALHCLHHLLQDMSNQGVLPFLWKYILIAPRASQRQFDLPAGTLEIEEFNWVSVTNPTAAAFLPADNASAPNAFNKVLGGTPATATAIENWFGVDYGATTTFRPDIVGINSNNGGTYNLVLEFSTDGLAWTTQSTLPAVTLLAGEWNYFQVDGALAQRYWRVRSTDTTLLILNQVVFAQSAYTIPVQRLNRTDYWNLPNRSTPYGTRTLQYWLDYQDPNKIINFWPIIQDDFQVFEVVAQAVMPDISFETVIPVPNYWINYVQCALSAKLAFQLPGVDPNRLVTLQQIANQAYVTAASTY